MKWKGVAAVVMASLIYGILPIFAKEGATGPMPPQCYTFFRFAVSCVAAGGFGLLQRASFRVTRRQLLELAFFGVAGFGFTNFFLVMAYLYIPVGLATMCHFSFPILVTIAMMAVFREKCTGPKLTAIFLSLSGLLFILLSDRQLSVFGLLAALASSITYGLYIISNDRCQYRTLNRYVIVFYVCLFAALFFGCSTAIQGQLTVHGSAKQWGCIMVSGLTSILAIYGMAAGIQLLGATTASFLNMLEPVTSVVSDILVYRSIPTLATGAGSALMLLSILLVSLDERLGELKLRRAASAGLPPDALEELPQGEAPPQKESSAATR